MLGEVLNSYISAMKLFHLQVQVYTFEDFNYKFDKALAIYIGHHEFRELIQKRLMIYYCKLNPSYREYYLQWFDHKQKGVII